ncbi:hypothetical protein [Lacipirellula sp.]|uniref:hypothetical protein n=1 Tax=Lacipirellula sp. TaxID=2691419 RepID=UPI003D0B6D42
MNYNDRIAAGTRDLADVRQFLELFPHAEHAIVQSKHDFPPGGWQLVQEWISRTSLFDRYVLWLAIPVEFTAEGTASELDRPAIYVTEVEKVVKGRQEQGGPKWECGFGQIEEDDWLELVQVRGDFDAAGADLTKDDPVEGFATFWRDTCPPPDARAPEDITLRAPLRFVL